MQFSHKGKICSFLLVQVPLTFGFVGVFHQDVQAAPVRQGRQVALLQIDRSVALGNRAKPPTVVLVPGHGVNISFIPTGEIIEKIWLDNPQYATLDVDGCLESQHSGRKCDSPGAQVVHLRRIVDLNFPGLHSTPDTTLTVVTRDASSGSRSSNRSVYTFRVAKGSGVPRYSVIEIVSGQGRTAANGANVVNLANNSAGNSEVSSVSYETLATGMQVALAQGILQYRSNLWYRINDFLLRLKAGTPLQMAMGLSGLNERIVSRLRDLGTGNGLDRSPMVPSAPVYSEPDAVYRQAYPAVPSTSRRRSIPVSVPVYQAPQQVPVYSPVYQAPQQVPIYSPVNIAPVYQTPRLVPPVVTPYRSGTAGMTTPPFVPAAY
ncbi:MULTISPECIES: hypothetical protein [Aerosakkonema]|uniref:hypothetical protein n=1 Tax=Aerosakkonema TaxID=1246629 RepID=UPI0035BA177F